MNDIASMIAQAKRDWPELVVDEKRFAELVMERVTEETPLASLRASDLWLVCGCAAGDPRSLAAFERLFAVEISAAVRRVRNPSLSEEDVAQLVREKLFVGTGTSGPKLLEYRAAGSLKGWLRVTAARVALNLATRGPREQPADGEWFARIVAEGDHPEIAHLKEKYRTEFRAALEAGVAALDPKSRNVLRYSYGDRLSIDQIGGIYGVHRATAARWVTAAQERLVAETRAVLMHRLGASASEIDSIVHLIASRFDASLAGMLKEEP